MTFKRGDFVTVTYCKQNIKAMVLLASPNGRSLMLGFDGALRNASGMFAGSMPVMQDDSGEFFDLMNPPNPVRLERIEHGKSITCSRCGRTSYNPSDIAAGYCGACHAWTTPR